MTQKAFSLPEIVSAEKMVLSSCLTSAATAEEAISLLEPTDFYVDAHRAIFDVLIFLVNGNRTVNIISVIDLIKTRGLNESCISTAYELLDNAGTPKIDSYCKMIVDKSICRKIITASAEITQAARESEDVDELVDLSERAIYNAASRKTDSAFCHSGDMVSSALESVSQAQVHGGIIGTPTYFPDVDNMFGGFEAGTFTIIAGRPSMGKSALLVSILTKQAVQNNIPIGIFSLEMKRAHIGMRFLAMIAKKNLFALRQGMVNMADPIFLDAQSRIAQAPIWIDDNPFLSINRLRSSIRRIKKQKGINTFYIDHVGLMQFDHKDPVQGMTMIAKGLQQISREFDVAIVALSQLHRIPPSLKKGVMVRPGLQDLKQSGALEECADVVAFIHRNHYYSKKDEEKNQAEFIIEKQRNGPTGIVPLNWFPEFAEFTPFSIDNTVGF